MSVTADQLTQVPLLAKLGTRARRSVAETMRERSIPAGSEVVTQGERGVGFFVILSGEADVVVDNEARRTLGPGDYFGEVALIVDVPRTATITARTDLEVAALTSWQFRPLVLEQPDIAWTLLQALAERAAGPAPAAHA